MWKKKVLRELGHVVDVLEKGNIDTWAERELNRIYRMINTYLTDKEE